MFKIGDRVRVDPKHTIRDDRTEGRVLSVVETGTAAGDPVLVSVKYDDGGGWTGGQEHLELIYSPDVLFTYNSRIVRDTYDGVRDIHTEWLFSYTLEKKNMKSFLFWMFVMIATVAGFALLISPAHAQAVGTWQDGPIPAKDTTYNVTVNGNTLVSMPLSSPITTDALKLKGFRYLLLQIDLVRSTATSVLVMCQFSDNGTKWATWQTLQYDTTLNDGTFAVNPTKLKHTVSASDTWPLSVPVRSVFVRCSFAGGGAGAGDLLTVVARGGF